ncbi:hypothetical protein Hanom_Chr17g01529341 [Helianthus anomalus]
MSKLESTSTISKAKNFNCEVVQCIVTFMSTLLHEQYIHEALIVFVYVMQTCIEKN